MLPSRVDEQECFCVEFLRLLKITCILEVWNLFKASIHWLKMQKKKKILMVIGSQKVEKEVYEETDSNISVTGQPHSEIAALAVTLDRIQQGKELDKRFSKSKIKIIPQKKGKMVKKRR